VFIFTRFKQLKLLTDKSSSSIVISSTLSFWDSAFSTTVGVSPIISDKSVNSVKWSHNIFDPKDTASLADIVLSVCSSRVSLSKSVTLPTRVFSTW